MYSVLKSYGLNGLNGFAVAVEADVSGGLPAFSLVGLPDSAVRESGDRVRSAVKNLGYKWPDRHITVNLAPADIRKSGPVYDLPLLLAVLASSGQMEEPPADAAFLGELALDGSLRPVSGVLPMALAAAEKLAAEGISARVVDMHTIKPLDTELVLKAAKETGAIVTTEEANVLGGLGAAVAEYLSENYPVPVVRHGVNDEFGRSGKAPLVLDAYGVNADGIIAKVKQALAMKK